MKYLLLLLALAGCGQKAQKEAPVPAEQTAEIGAIGQQEVMSVPGEDTYTEENGYIDRTGDFLNLTEEEIALYTNGTKYSVEYGEFFRIQLISFGTNSKGKYRIDINQFDKFMEKYPPFVPL